MTEHEFDKFADDYDQLLDNSIPSFLRENHYFAEYKISTTAALLNPLKPKHILDFGCGAGRSLSHLTKYFPDAEIFGYDPSYSSIKIAAHQHPDIKLFHNLDAIPHDHFDLIFSSNVFHHIALDERLQMLEVCRSLLAPAGEMFIFEHNPLNPVTRYIFARCPMDADAEMISMKEMQRLLVSACLSLKACGFTMFFPRQLALLRPLEHSLRCIPMGAQYYVRINK